jgi:hypothetical protein
MMQTVSRNQATRDKIRAVSDLKPSSKSTTYFCKFIQSRSLVDKCLHAAVVSKRTASNLVPRLKNKRGTVNSCPALASDVEAQSYQVSSGVAEVAYVCEGQ